MNTPKGMPETWGGEYVRRSLIASARYLRFTMGLDILAIASAPALNPNSWTYDEQQEVLDWAAGLGPNEPYPKRIAAYLKVLEDVR